MLRAITSDLRNAFEFIEQLDRLSNPDEIAAAMRRTVSRFGFENVILAGIDRDKPFERQVLANGWPAEFSDLYIGREYIRFDPIARRCRRAASPFEWSKSTYAHERDPRALEVMDAAAQFHIRCGFIVPIHGPHGYAAAVSMAGRNMDLSPRSGPAVHLMALYAFDRARRLSGARPRSNRMLTAREREVLSWAAQGKSAGEIGEILGIAKRTVDEHAQTAARKLGAASRTQAVAIALGDRLIEL